MGKKAVTMVVNSIFLEVLMKDILSCLPNHQVGWKNIIWNRFQHRKLP